MGLSARNPARSYLCTMRILVVSATQAEAAPLQQLLTEHPVGHDVQYLVTGIGMTATAYALTRYLLTLPVDLALNIGLAGSFRRDLEPGTSVWVKEDRFSDLGAEDGETFLGLRELGFTDPVNVLPYGLDRISLPAGIPGAVGATVNTVHGKETTIQEFRNREQADIETMEGAAFYYVCEREKVASLQLRGISNYVERRNRANWKIAEALTSLSRAAHYFIRKL